jgi:hypothetical protein
MAAERGEDIDGDTVEKLPARGRTVPQVAADGQFGTVTWSMTGGSTDIAGGRG